MNTFKRMAGFLMALLCLTAVISIIWYCLFGQRDPSEPGGTLVKTESLLPGNGWAQQEGDGR